MILANAEFIMNILSVVRHIVGRVCARLSIVNNSWNYVASANISMKEAKMDFIMSNDLLWNTEFINGNEKSKGADSRTDQTGTHSHTF